MSRQREVLESYWRAECGRDIDLVMDHYAQNSRFVAPGWDLQGKDQIRRYYEDSASRFPGLEVAVLSDFSDGKWAAVEWAAVLVDASGMRYPITGVNLATLEGELLSEVRAYFDTSSLSKRIES